MIVIDNFLKHPETIRAHAFQADWKDWEGPDGEVYKRIAMCSIPGVKEGLETAMGDIDIHGMAYRLNFGGEKPNASIHSDMGWGSHALVLYLCEGEGGTAFWRHKSSGASRIEPGDVALYEKVKDDWDDASKWNQIGLAEIRFNRAVIYESALFHSRWPFEAFGTNEQDGRLIAVCFFTVKS